MKQKLYVSLCILAVAGMATACGTSFKATESTVYVTKKGTVISADIEDFNEDYYDGDELKNYITESVESYVASNGDGSVEIESFEIHSPGNEENTAQLYLNYADYTDYARFNEVTFFAGTVLQALAEDYGFDQDFQKTEEGNLAGSVDAQEVMDAEDYKVVVIGEETAVKVDGEIQYVSDGNVELTGKDTAKASYDVEDPDAKPAYIIYK